MKKLILGSVALAAMITDPAMAADMPVRAPSVYRAPAPAWSWTGFYVGGEVGAKWLDDRWTATSLFDGGGPLTGSPALPIDASSPRHYDITGARVGGYVGYNWQFDSKWVAGIEADAAWAHELNASGFSRLYNSFNLRCGCVCYAQRTAIWRGYVVVPVL